MKIKGNSGFKDPVNDLAYFEEWVKKLEQVNGRVYERIEIQTQIGKTHIWGLNIQDPTLATLVIFPGARTTALIWDLDRGLDNLSQKLRIFMVETNGLPNLSDGATPDIKSLDYGHWAKEVLEKLNITKAFIAGASFGGLICMKLGIVAPEKVRAAFLLNPGCLQPFSLSFKNLYYNILPIVRPTANNVAQFLNKAVFSKPNHALSSDSEKKLVDYEVFAISRYKDKTQKPYAMGKELLQAHVNTYLLLGERDLLFPFQKSIDNAEKYIKSLKEIRRFREVGHGIETHHLAMQYLGDIMHTYR